MIGTDLVLSIYGNDVMVLAQIFIRKALTFKCEDKETRISFMGRGQILILVGHELPGSSPDGAGPSLRQLSDSK